MQDWKCLRQNEHIMFYHTPHMTSSLNTWIKEEAHYGNCVNLLKPRVHGYILEKIILVNAVIEITGYASRYWEKVVSVVQFMVK